MPIVLVQFIETTFSFIETRRRMSDDVSPVKYSDSEFTTFGTLYSTKVGEVSSLDRAARFVMPKKNNTCVSCYMAKKKIGSVGRSSHFFFFFFFLFLDTPRDCSRKSILIVIYVVCYSSSV